MLQGKYVREPELYNDHVIYKMQGHNHYIYYSNVYQSWVINQDREKYMEISENEKFSKKDVELKRRGYSYKFDFLTKNF